LEILRSRVFELDGGVLNWFSLNAVQYAEPLVELNFKFVSPLYYYSDPFELVAVDTVDAGKPEVEDG
jgi:hypothetical protein